MCRHSTTRRMWRLGESWCGWVPAVRAGRSWDEFGARICNHCGTWLPLGESNDADERVQVEMRAAELYACANHGADEPDARCHCYRPSHLLPDPHDEAEARRLYQEMWDPTHSEES